MCRSEYSPKIQVKRGFGLSSYHLLSSLKIVILFESIYVEVEGSTVVRYGIPISPVEPKGGVVG